MATSNATWYVPMGHNEKEDALTRVISELELGPFIGKATSLATATGLALSDGISA